MEKAEGLMGDAFTGRAVLHRERENLKKEVIQVDIKASWTVLHLMYLCSVMMCFIF